MDLTPPSLTRSPSSCSNTYCPSDRSSLDYPSPSLVDQQYRLSSIYDGDAPCSIHASMDPESPLPPLNAMGQPEWSAATVLHPSSSSASTMPSIISAGYDAFGSYESALPQVYGQDVYQPQHAQAHQSSTSNPRPLSTDSRSPPPASSRTVASYATVPSVSRALSSRVKLETASDYGQGIQVSHYPSPSPVHAAYHPDNSSYPSNTSGYPPDGPSSWQKPDYQPVEPDQFYYPTSGSTASTPMQDDRRPYHTTRPRKAPRRLTTKEEANFQCQVNGCGKLFSRSYNFKAHKETHDEKREYPFLCPVGECNKKFVRKTDLQRHHQSVHMKERSHKCDYCSRLFARKDTLRRHMDDGCSKRFDISTLDLQADSYDSLNQSIRTLGGPIGQMIPPPGGLPPMAIPPLEGIPTSVSRAMRSRDSTAGAESNQSHPWGRC